MTYDSEVLADSPLAYLKLDETSGTSAADSSGNSKTFTAASAPTWSHSGLLPAGSGTSAAFSTSTALSRGSGDIHGSGSDFTAEAWIKPSTVTGYGCIASADATTTTTRGWSLYVTSGKLNLFTTGDNLGSTTLSTGTVYHVAFTYVASTTTLKLYVNGSLDGTFTVVVNTNPVQGSDTFIGASHAGSGGLNFAFGGDIDNVAFYGSALTATRLAAHYSAGVAASAAASGSATLALSASGAARAVAAATATLVLVAGGTASGPSTPAGGSASLSLSAGGTAVAGSLPGAGSASLSLSAVGTVYAEPDFTYGDPATLDDPPAEIAAALAAALAAGQRADMAIALPDPVVVDGFPTNPDYATARAVYAANEWRDFITVDGVDITWIRHNVQPVQRPGYRLSEPFAYDTSDNIELAKWWGGYEFPTWGRHGAFVAYGRVNTTTGERIVDYRGRILSPEPDGSTLRYGVGGHPYAAGNIHWRPKLVVVGTADVGAWAYQVASQLGIRMTPVGGPTTGKLIRNKGNMSQIAFAQYLCQISQDRNGIQWTFMPSDTEDAVWEFRRKDYVTKHFTLYHDNARIVVSAADDLQERPNEFYAEFVTPAGVRTRNSKFPGVFDADPPAFGGTMSLGDSGGQVPALISKLKYKHFLDFDEPSDGFSAAVQDAVKDVQAEGHLSQTGVVNTATWDVLWDNSVLGRDAAGAHIAPFVADPRTRRWNESVNGSYVSLNTDYDPSVIPVSVFNEGLNGLTKPQALAVLRGKYNRSQNLKNWVGTIVLSPGWGGIVGEHNYGDPAITSADVFPARNMRPGMNVWVPSWDGGTLFHIAGVDVAADDTVTLTVDTQARDLLEVEAIRQRDSESRMSIQREWRSQNRDVSAPNNFITFDENGGILADGENRNLTHDHWNSIPILMGQTGQVFETIFELYDNVCEFAWCITSVPIPEARLDNVIGDPFAKDDAHGENVWQQSGTVADWIADKTLLAFEGQRDQPCGYGTRDKIGDNGKRTTAPLTGKMQSIATWGYTSHSDIDLVFYLNIWPKDEDSKVRPSRSDGRVVLKMDDDAT